MNHKNKVIVWLYGEVKTPPFTTSARIETGFLLRQLQTGEALSMPQSRPMQVIGKRCHELRINDEDKTWRVIYRIDEDAIIILEVFAKKTNTTAKKVINTCKKRLREYENAIK
jgi:phage-related protein